MKQKKYGKFIIADPNICHGQLTVKRTRVLVENVLNLVSKGISWDQIVNEWHGKVPKEAISEAVKLASQALQEKIEKEIKLNTDKQAA